MKNSDNVYVFLEQIASMYKNGKKIILFGAGSFGGKLEQYLKGQEICVSFFVDNDADKWGRFVNGIQILSMDELVEKNNDDFFILISSTWQKEIKEQLESREIENFHQLGFNEFYHLVYHLGNEGKQFKHYYYANQEKFFKVKNLLVDSQSQELYMRILDYRMGGLEKIKPSSYRQYYHPNVLPKKRDVIIDGGAFDGDTARQFNKFLDEDCEIYCFEPSPVNYMILKKYMEKQNGNVVVENKGLGSEEGVLYSNSTSEEINSGFTLSRKGENSISIVSLDDYVLKNDLSKINVIKLDIEGSELEALKGSENTIRNFRPDLQICLYHSKEDLLEIPLFLYNNFKDLDYQFYLGHHTGCYLETVLYATTNREPVEKSKE